MTNQNGINSILEKIGGISSLQNRLQDFTNTFKNQTNKSPEEVGRAIQAQMPPEQFQAFAAIADMVVGRRR